MINKRPLGSPKPKSTFGKRPSRGNFGKKISPIKKKPTTTPEDQAYLSWLNDQHYFTCFVCNQQNGIEWHHVKEHSTDKKNHKRLIPLCGVEHHREGSLSPHGTPKLWRATYTMREQNRRADGIYQEYKESKGY